MKRHLSENQTRPTAGCLSVPLFNQKRRSRLPLTSNPSENDFCPSKEYLSAQGFPSSSLSPGNSGNSEGNGLNYTSSAEQQIQWSRQGYPNSRPVAHSSGRAYAPLPHPSKTGNMGSYVGQKKSTSWQCSSVQPNTKQSFPSSRANVQEKSKPSYSYMQTGHQSSYRQPGAPEVFHPQQPERVNTTPPHPPATRVQWQSSTCQFKPHNSQFKEDTPKVFPTKTGPQPQKSAVPQFKPAMDNSLRILTTVIEGMKHWSQYKDKAPFLFEVFATLDSAVTVGSHGAKNFLMRDGKDVVQCVFYETDRDLPRLIRGQLHRCVGNYHMEKNLLTCVSVRPASSSEHRNAQEAVSVSDAEMRRLVRFFSEI